MAAALGLGSGQTHYTRNQEQDGRRQWVPCSCIPEHREGHLWGLAELSWGIQRVCSFTQWIKEEPEEYYFIKDDSCGFHFSLKLAMPWILNYYFFHCSVRCSLMLSQFENLFYLEPLISVVSQPRYKPSKYIAMIHTFLKCTGKCVPSNQHIIQKNFLKSPTNYERCYLLKNGSYWLCYPTD